MPRVAFQTMMRQAFVPEPNVCTVNLLLELARDVIQCSARDTCSING